MNMHVQIHAHVCTCVERPEVVPTIFPFSGHVTVTLVLCTPHPHTTDTNQINVKTLLFFFKKNETPRRLSVSAAALHGVPHLLKHSDEWRIPSEVTAQSVRMINGSGLDNFY